MQIFLNHSSVRSFLKNFAESTLPWFTYKC